MAAQMQRMRSQIEQLQTELLFYRGDASAPYDELQVCVLVDFFPNAHFYLLKVQLICNVLSLDSQAQSIFARSK